MGGRDVSVLDDNMGAKMDDERDVSVEGKMG